MRSTTLLLAQPLCAMRPSDLSGFHSPRLDKHRQQHDATGIRQPICDPGLLPQQTKPQLTNFPAQVPCVRLNQGLGILSEQTHHEVDSTEVAASEPFEPDPHLRLNLHRIQALHTYYAI